MGFFKTLILLAAIPVFGFLVSVWVQSDVNKGIAEQGTEYSIKQLCQPKVVAQLQEVKPLCDQMAPVFWLETVSIVSIVFSLVFLLSFTLFSSMAGQDRVKIARIFPPMIFIALVLLAILVFVQGVILTYGVYLAEAQAIQRVHYYLIAIVGIGALAACGSLVKASINLLKKQKHSVLGQKLNAQEHPELFSMIEDVSNQLGAKNPDNVIVGLEPNFYVTSADINIMGSEQVFSGATLYLSLPLARILTMDELKGIIGHELGHFRGDDTYFSMKFSPVYSGLSHALVSMENNQSGLDTIAHLPAKAVINHIMDVFHQNVSAVSREREFEADKAAAEVAPASALASSLLKLGLYANGWNSLEHRVVERLRRGSGGCRYLCRIFVELGLVAQAVGTFSIPDSI